MGASAALCHVRHNPAAASENGGCFTLTAANAGWCGAVLSRDGRAMPLSRTHTVEDREEYLRVRRHNAIVTEVTAAAAPRPCRRASGVSKASPPPPSIRTTEWTA